MADDTYSRGYRNDPYDRGGAGGSGQATDPLTELARLIGQSDPFSPERNRQPDPRYADPHAQPAEWQADPQQAQQYHQGEPQHYADDRYGAAEGHGVQNGYAYPQQAQQQPQHDAHYGDAAGYPEPAYQQDQQYHPDQHPHYQEQHYQQEQAYPQGQPAYQASGAPEHGGHGGYDAASDDPQAGHGAPPFFDTDPNMRPDDYYEDERAPRRGWLVTAAALVGLAVVGTAGAFAYRAVFTGGEARIITRDMSPNKITPAQTTQDSAAKGGNDRLASAGQNERLGPPPEQPLTIPDPPRTVPPAITQVQPAAPAPAPAPVVPAAPSAPAQASLPADNSTRKVRTEKIKPDQVGDTQAPIGPAPMVRTAPPAGRNVAPSPSAQPRVATTAPAAPGPNAPLSLAPQGVPDAPAPPPAPRVHTTAVAPPAQPVERNAGAGSGYYVQVSAQKSEEEAKSSFRGIQAHHSGLLGGQAPVIRRKDLGNRGIFYGAQVGPLSREAAAKLCEDLKAAGQSCMIQKN